MRIGKNRALLNATLSGLQVIVLGFSYFWIFRLIAQSLGNELLGIWSLVSSVSSVANVANLGISASLVKFVAVYHKDKEYTTINNMSKTGLVSVGMFMGIVVLILYLLGDKLLGLALKTESDRLLASKLLPISLFSLWLNTIAGVFLSVIDGLLLTYLRNTIYIVSSFVFCGVASIVIDRYQLMGVGYAQIAQILFIIVSANIALKIHLPRFEIFRFIWKKELFKEIFSYSVNFQVNSLLMLLVDPVTKFFLAKFGSLTEVGYYEMANRLVSQLRQVMININQSFVALIAQNSDNNKKVVEIYRSIFGKVTYISFPSFVILISTSVIVSLIWIGRIESFFIYSVYLLSTGYLANVIAAPSHFSCIGTGNLKLITISTVFMALLNIIMCYTFGSLLGGIGIPLSWSITLIFTSILQLYLYQKLFSIASSSVFNIDFKRLLIYFVLTALTSAIIGDYTVKNAIVNTKFDAIKLLLLCITYTLVLFYFFTRKIAITKSLLSKLSALVSNFKSH